MNTCQPELLPCPAVRTLPTRDRLAAALPRARRFAPFVPRSFHGTSLSPEQWRDADRWHNMAAVWRDELDTDNATPRFNRAVLAALLRVCAPRDARLPKHCMAAARAGVERIVWERTGRKVQLAKRVKPSRIAVPLRLRGVFQGVFNLL